MTDKDILNKAFAIVAERLKTEDKVILKGLGTFKKVHREARTGINPNTQQPIAIPAKTVIKFTSAAAFESSCQ